MSLRPLLLVLAAFALLAVPQALCARDMAEYGYYLGVRLKMYDEAEQFLQGLLDRGTEESKSSARSALARVYKARGDEEFARSGDDAARAKYYGMAVELYEDAKRDDDKVELAILRLELARSQARTDPEKARERVDRAIDVLMELFKPLNDLRNNEVGFTELDKWAKHYERYRKVFYNICVAYHVKALSYNAGSAERVSNVKKSNEWIDELSFSIDVSFELLDAMILQGDLMLALNQPEAAVEKFLGVPSYLEGMGANYAVGLYSLRGYLRAAELLTAELDYEPRNLERVIEFFNKAISDFNSVTELSTELKRLRLFKISAQIKLGQEISGAIDDLFKLGQDPDIAFKRQALDVLAEISTRQKLDNELRLRCARLVAKERIDLGQLLKVIPGYQALLAECNDKRTFERYGPECFYQIGMIYRDSGRWVDAAMVFREAALRTAYFRGDKQFVSQAEQEPNAGIALPEHMKDMCEIIKDTKGAFAFPSVMAGEYEKVCKWLVSKEHGDPSSREFQNLLRDAEDVKVRFADYQQKLDKDYSDLLKLVKEEPVAAAKGFASMDPVYRRYRLCLYNAALLYSGSMEKRPQRINDARKRELSESDDWFGEMRDRHAAEFAPLPEELWTGLEAEHWSTILDPKTQGEVAAWHKAVYFLKKYMLYIVLQGWDDISGRYKKGMDYIDAFYLVADARNEKWQQTPKDRRQPDGEMEFMGRAGYELARLFRNPAEKDPNREKLKNDNRQPALRVLRKLSQAFGPHLSGADAAVFRSAVLELSFYGLAEDMDGDGCEQILAEFETAFADKKDTIAKFIRMIYAIYRETLAPKDRALNLVSTNLKSLFNELNRGAFANETNDKVAGLKDAKTQVARHRALAAYFWTEYVEKKAFTVPVAAQARPEVKADAALQQAAVDAFKPALMRELEVRWDRLAKEYPEQWGKALKAEFERLIKSASYDPIRADATKLVNGAKQEEILDQLEAKGRGGESDKAKADLYAQLAAQLNADTAHLKYFVGVTWIYDYGRFLQRKGEELDAEARPIVTKVLTYYRRFRETSDGGKGLQGLSKDTIFGLGKQYFRVRDWTRTIDHLSVYLATQEKENAYGNPKVIPSDPRNRTVGGRLSGEELELRYQLGRAYFERALETNSVADLQAAALNMRRAYCYVLVRNANEMAKNQRPVFKAMFQDDMEQYFQDIVETMAQIYTEMHKRNTPAPKWPEWADQFNVNLAPGKDKAGKDLMQVLPVTAPQYLWESRRIRQDVWSSFARLPDHPFRSEYRESLILWIDKTTEWLQLYGKDTKGVPDLKSAAELEAFVKEAIGYVATASRQELAFEDKGTLDFKTRVKEAGKRLEAAATKAGIKFK